MAKAEGLHCGPGERVPLTAGLFLVLGTDMTAGQAWWRGDSGDQCLRRVENRAGPQRGWWSRDCSQGARVGPVRPDQEGEDQDRSLGPTERTNPTEQAPLL